MTEEKTTKNLSIFERNVIDLMSKSLVVDDRMTIFREGSESATYQGTCEIIPHTNLQQVTITKNAEFFYYEVYDNEQAKIICQKVY